VTTVNCALKEHLLTYLLKEVGARTGQRSVDNNNMRDKEDLAGLDK